jgi:pheromone a factor receptor
MTYYFFAPYYEVIVALGLVLLALAAPEHFRARNTGTILYICWTALGTSIILINKLIWHDHVRNIAPIWCDISQSINLSPSWFISNRPRPAGKFLIGFFVSIGASFVVINRRLYKISCISSVVTPAQKRRQLITDLLIGLGIPFLIMCTRKSLLPYIIS